MTVRDSIRGYILENLLFTDDQSQFEDQTFFMEIGIIDSTGILELIMFLEDEFGVSIDEEGMTVENFGSVENMVDFVDRSRSAAS